MCVCVCVWVGGCIGGNMQHSRLLHMVARAMRRMKCEDRPGRCPSSSLNQCVRYPLLTYEPVSYKTLLTVQLMDMPTSLTF